MANYGALPFSPMKRYSIGEAVCGDALRNYLRGLNLSTSEVDSIMRGITEFKFTTLAIDNSGGAIDWDQYADAPVGPKSMNVAERIARSHRVWFNLELWRHEIPDCMVLRDRKDILSFLGPYAPGLT